MEKRAEGDGENAALGTFNMSQRNAANVVGQQLLLNMLKNLQPLKGSAGAAEPVAGSNSQ